MTGRAFVGAPDNAALWNPFIAPAHPQSRGIPLGINLRTLALVCMDFWSLATHSTVFSIEGNKNAGKSSFMKTVGPRFMTLQAGVNKLATGGYEPHVMKARYHARKSEDGRTEMQPTADFLHAPVYDLAESGHINPFDIRLVKTESHMLEIAISLVETIKGSRLTGDEPLAMQVGVHIMHSHVDQAASIPALEIFLRTLTATGEGNDLDSYFDSTNSATLSKMKEIFYENPEFAQQLKIQITKPINLDPTSFLNAAGRCSVYIGQLLHGEFGTVFGMQNSLYDALSQTCAVFNYEGIPAKVRPIIDSLLWSWQASDIERVQASSGGFSSITPHLNFSDEEGSEMLDGNLANARARSKFVNSARAYPTADFTAVQYNRQRTAAGGADDEIRTLGQNIERGIGARFVFQQPNDPDVLHAYSLLGVSDRDISLLPLLDTGQCMVLVPGDKPTFMQYVITPLEWNNGLIESNSARAKMKNRMPLWSNPAYMERLRNAQREQIGG